MSLDVPQGAFVALLGVNGAGKSTLVNLVTRLYAHQSGSIRVWGADLSRAPAAALRALGVVFQSRSLDASLTVKQNLLYVGALYGQGRRESLTRAEALLDRLRLGDRLNERVGTLSGGQQRRIEIARALMHRPKLLLCDEATAGLDIRSRQEAVELARELAAKDGVGVLWATHLTEEARAEDPVVVLHEGRVLAEGRAADIARAHGGEQASLREAFLALTAAGAEAAR